MGKQTKRTKAKGKARQSRFNPAKVVRRWLLRGALLMMSLLLVAVLGYGMINPPLTHTMWEEEQRLGGISRQWVDVEDIAPVMLRSVVAAEDANFCSHWGFDMTAIKAAIADGARRGGSTISQQTVKNVYLWQDRSYVRKAMEAALTPAVEAVWSKRRILEVYLNVAEFGEGVFGVEAAAQHHFGRSAAKLTADQAALLAAVLPSPKKRSASRPSGAVLKRARGIADGANTIQRDGRAACFED